VNSSPGTVGCHSVTLFISVTVPVTLFISVTVPVRRTLFISGYWSLITQSQFCTFSTCLGKAPYSSCIYILRFNSLSMAYLKITLSLTVTVMYQIIYDIYIHTHTHIHTYIYKAPYSISSHSPMSQQGRLRGDCIYIILAYAK
jgi:hypothetical protein